MAVGLLAETLVYPEAVTPVLEVDHLQVPFLAVYGYEDSDMAALDW
jgi:hypothetical protein